MTSKHKTKKNGKTKLNTAEAEHT